MSKNNLKKFFNFTTIRPIEILFFLFVIVVSVGLLATPYYLFAIIPGLAILFLLFLGHNPQFGYYLIVFLIPFDAYRGLSGPYQFLTISKFVGFWIAIVILFYFLLNKMDSVNIKSNMWSLFLIFFVIRFLSALMSEYFFTSLDNLRQF